MSGGVCGPAAGRIFLRIAGVCLVALVVAGCATPGGPGVPVPQPPPRIQQQGYSFVPLDEPDWLVIGRDASKIALVKMGRNDDETFAIQATLFPLPSFDGDEALMAIVKAGQARDIDPKRFRLTTHDVNPEPARLADCVRSHAVAEDNAAVKRSGRSGAMILETLTLTCAHPRSRGVAVNVAYSHRHYPGDEDARFTAKAEEVFGSVRFTGE